MSTSHQPGYPVGGDITERYIRYEAEKAKGMGITLTVDQRLVEVRASGNKLIAVLENTYQQQLRVERVVDQVIGDYGTTLAQRRSA